MKPNLQPAIRQTIAKQTGVFTTSQICDQTPGEGEIWNRHNCIVAVRKCLADMCKVGTVRALSGRYRTETLYALSSVLLTDREIQVAKDAAYERVQALRRRAHGWMVGK